MSSLDKEFEQYLNNVSSLTVAGDKLIPHTHPADELP